MTDFLHWRMTTWALLLWSGYTATWAVLTGSGPAILVVWWLVGLVVFLLLFAAQPLFGHGRGLDGFVRPGWTRRRAIDLHRTDRRTESRRDAG